MLSEIKKYVPLISLRLPKRNSTRNPPEDSQEQLQLLTESQEDRVIELSGDILLDNSQNVNSNNTEEL